ncbi:hypothetical protein MAPG_08611 [Magnaporthiopsis poae ATCC 64411]|uniref:Uncharacterized protein n=1 Tax=Magnaporthiopsis poae (strain ATCC 64411 / 73-15) TaxID=644358 RepID=A0A0C4E7T9_MAGP6|nr:hypothetical protein MAPG_08611 [Magnaporthiopsis poae ATCC 64411]
MQGFNWSKNLRSQRCLFGVQGLAACYQSPTTSSPTQTNCVNRWILRTRFDSPCTFFYTYTSLSVCSREWRPGSSRCWQPTASQQSLSQIPWLSFCHPSIPAHHEALLSRSHFSPTTRSRFDQPVPAEHKNRSTRDFQLAVFPRMHSRRLRLCFPFCYPRIIPTVVKRTQKTTLKSLPEDKMPDQPPAKFAKCKHCQTTLYVTAQDCIVCFANPWQHCGNLLCGGLPPIKHNPSPKKNPGQSSINKSLWVGHKEDGGGSSKNKVDDFEDVKETVGDTKEDINEEVGMVGDMDP